VAKLSESEKAALARLQAKAEAPDEGPISKAINVTINLGDKAQVALAKKMGFLPDDDEEVTEEMEGEEGDETPKRKGYFG
jgi:hypothetical protein